MLGREFYSIGVDLASSEAFPFRRDKRRDQKRLRKDGLALPGRDAAVTFAKPRRHTERHIGDSGRRDHSGGFRSLAGRLRIYLAHKRNRSALPYEVRAAVNVCRLSSFYIRDNGAVRYAEKYQ